MLNHKGYIGHVEFDDDNEMHPLTLAMQILGENLEQYDDDNMSRS